MADQETQQKIKYAKWNAARIIKAIREGVDPNESNPKREEVQQPTQGDVFDDSLSRAAIPRPATVEDAPDADLRRDAAGVSLPQSPASAGPSPASDDELQLPGVPTGLGETAHRGYFDTPSMPSPISPHSNAPSNAPSNYHGALDLPPPPAGAAWSQSQPSPEASPPPTAWSQPPANPPPASGWTQASTGFAPSHQPFMPPTGPPTFSMSTPSTAAVASPPVSPPTNPYYMNMAPTAHTAQPSAHSVVPTPASYAPAQSSGVVVDEAAMVNAQKHAKWAISALNFEDVNTAVKELRRALELLGAT